jgi:hypothetical protein
MSKEILSKLEIISEEFGDIAKKVNSSSKLRKEKADNSLKLIDDIDEICNYLMNEFQKVADADSKQREQDCFVLYTCKNIAVNIEEQKNIINEIKGNLDISIFDKTIAILDKLDLNVKEVISNIEIVLEGDNKILFLDNQLLVMKQNQMKSVSILKGLSETSSSDAKKAIEGSSKNLDRGLKMVEKYKKLETNIKSGNIDMLKALADEAHQGWKIAVDVNQSSKAQFDFANRVNDFTKNLHENSVKIKDIVKLKHNFFEGNLQVFTVLTVIIAMKFKKYLTIATTFDDIQHDSKIESKLNELDVYISIAINDINKIMSLNYDMTESSHINNQLETKAVELTDNEIKIYDKIKDEVKSMTEATKYPIEGSDKNIVNGKELEVLLKKLIEEI